LNFYIIVQTNLERDERQKGFGTSHKANRDKEKEFYLNVFKSMNYWQNYNI
jgi:hypothetical protein